jgi:hypothetical protein
MKGSDGFVQTCNAQIAVDAPRPAGRGPLPKTATLTDRMRRKGRAKRGADVYRWRKAIVEPVVGQIKHARGFRQFLLRGVANVRGEWSLVCLTHHVLKYYAPIQAGGGVFGADRSPRAAGG